MKCSYLKQKENKTLVNAKKNSIRSKVHVIRVHSMAFDRILLFGLMKFLFDKFKANMRDQHYLISATKWIYWLSNKLKIIALHNDISNWIWIFLLFFLNFRCLLFDKKNKTRTLTKNTQLKASIQPQCNITQPTSTILLSSRCWFCHWRRQLQREELHAQQNLWPY